MAEPVTLQACVVIGGHVGAGAQHKGREMRSGDKEAQGQSPDLP